MQSIKEAVAKGRARLIQKFPLLLEASERATATQAEALGITLEELKEVTLLKSLDAFARKTGEDLLDILIRYGSDSELEANVLLAKRATLINQAIEENTQLPSA